MSTKQKVQIGLAILGVVGFAAFIAIAFLGVKPSVVFGALIVLGFGWVMTTNKSNSKPSRKAALTDEEVAAASERIKREAINRAIGDPQLTEDQRNQLLKHLLATPTTPIKRG